MTDKIVYNGKFFQVITRSSRTELDIDGKKVTKDLTIELVRRPPGVRAIIEKDGKLMLNREYRYELKDWDYRLPGGKVFDSLEEFQTALESDTVEESAYGKLAEEVLEEADIKVEDFRLFAVSQCGLTVEWDLYYFIVDKFQVLPSFYSEEKQKSEFEYIEHVWLTFEQVKQLVFQGKMQEDRSISMLFKYMMEM